MFSGVLQTELLSILYSCGSKPLAIWESKARNGHIKRITDSDIRNSLVLELTGTNVATTYISAPINPHASLGIKLPFLCMVIKNLKKYFSFEITILDDKNMRRRLRASNYQSTTRVRPFCCTMPLGLTEGWNQIQFNLADFTRRAYGTNYVECVRVQIHANCRLRRIYFSDHLFSEADLPDSYRMGHADDAELHRQHMMHRQQAMQASMLQQEQDMMQAQQPANAVA
ncbi:cilia- and flagella-associated protein 20-like isoform X2 [Thrips palmi]|uniref:Cilia- and flagella-associated protein 20-like isoform X2 n=1 Tax=Thrips palmi TaxID=161013 RepID=A0A6P9AAP7_THRPL|nr:cilia- and flagella-associated protein 20-like isoform X2 [Thrips palmi]